MAFGCTITVNAGQMPSSQGNFVWLATAANFPLAAKDGGASSILNGGGNLRCYTDSTKATRLPLDVVSFVTGVTPVIQVWGLSPALNVASTVYIEADDTATTQPAFGAAFGRNAVRTGVAGNWHLDEDPTSSAPQYTDSSGNGNDGTASVITSDAGKIGDSSSHSTTSSINCGTGVFLELNTFTFSAWINPTDVSASGTALILYSKADDITQAGIEIGISKSAAGNIAIAWKDTAVRGWYTANAGIVSNSWQLVTVTRNAATGALKFYKNGSLVSSQTQGTGTIVYSNDTVLIGDQVQNRNYQGLLDEVSMSDTVKSDDYIASEYNNQSDPASFWSASAWVDLGGGATSSLITDLDCRNSIFDAVISDTDLRNKISGFLLSDVDIRAKIYNGATSDLDVRNNILGIAFSDLDLRNKVFNLAYADLDIRNEIINEAQSHSVITDLDVRNSLSNAALSDLTIQNKILQATLVDVDFRNKILQAITRDVDIRTKVYQFVTSDVDIRNQTYGFAISDLDIRNSVDGERSQSVIEKFTFSFRQDDFSIDQGQNDSFTITEHNQNFTLRN